MKTLLPPTGKSSLLSVLAAREVPIPEHVDIFMLKREMPPSDKTALQTVIEVDQERLRLEHEAEVLAARNDEGQSHFPGLQHGMQAPQGLQGFFEACSPLGKERNIWI